MRLLVTSAPPRLPGPTVDPTIDVCGCENLGSSLARDHSKLIHVAFRGFFDSDPMLTCPEMTPVRVAALAKPSFDPAEIGRGTDAMRRCHARLVSKGIDPAQYNYDTAAQDLLDLMYALRVHRANFVAFEFADAEVFDVLHRAPAAVRSLTLDNPPPPGITPLSDPIGDLSGAFERYAALCNADPTCAHSYPHLAGSWRSAYARANATRSPVTVPNPIRSKLGPVRVLFDGPRGAVALASALGDPGAYPVIPAAITQLNNPALGASVAVQADYPDPTEPWGAEASFGCAYDFNTQDPQTQALEAHTLPQFVRANTADWNQWCNAWRVPDVSAVLFQAVVSNVPALFFRGDLAPNGNPDWIPTIGRGLSNLQTVVFPSLGSDLLANGPPCLSALRRQFLANPTATLDTTACEKSSPKIRFVAPSG